MIILAGISHGFGAHIKTQPYLCFIYCELVSLHAFRQVWLPDGVFHQCEELRLSFSRSPTLSKDATPNVNLRAQNAVNECFDLLVYARKPRLHQTSCCFWCEPTILGGSYWVGADLRNQVSFDRFPPFITEFHLAWVFEIKLHLTIDFCLPVVCAYPFV